MKNWWDIDRKLVLASQSPRRREILTNMGLSFTISLPQNVDEEAFFQDGKSVEESLTLLATAKAASVAPKEPEALILGADTIVLLEERVIGKPRDTQDAREILQALAGKTHTVLSGVALLSPFDNFSASITVRTEVFFRSYGEQELENYLATASYLDKAGAYAIQEEGLTFVHAVQGCYYNIVGLPVSAVIELFERYQLHRERV